MDDSGKPQQLFKKIEYPLRYRPENLAKSSIILFVSLFFFLLLFEPFGVYRPEQKFGYVVICGLHALSPSLIFFAYFQALNYFGKRRTEPGVWTSFQEYLQMAILFLLIGVASFLMRDLIYANPDNWSMRYLWEEIRNCYLAGVLFYLFLKFGAFYFMSKKSLSPVDAAPEAEKRSASTMASEIFIKTQVKQDDFSFVAGDLLFARAEGNYIELTLYRNGVVATELKRISLKQFELQIADFPSFFRCHRAYLVNLAQIKNVSGNSQGYFLSFQDATEKVPVSRAQLASFNNLYKPLSAA
jgi:hypothetical protein